MVPHLKAGPPLTSAAAYAPSLREVRTGLSEILRPVSRLQQELANQWPLTIDLEQAKRRVRAGRPAFDPLDVLAAAGDLRLPFHRATLAFEHAGLATSAAAADARGMQGSLVSLGASWLHGEPLATHEPRRLAQRATALVVGSILRRAAGSARPAVRGASPERTSCPACGSAPEFSIATAEGRRLVCAHCDTAWRVNRMGCLGCGAADAPAVVRIRSADIGYDLVVCNACGRYIKERTRRGGSDLLVERALTAQLDAAAERRGLRL